ncbi:MAG: polyprenyl synthetase family protein [Lentisphaeraceae bacterium]|nr:polyprenyl synthetase family protein [Lentisphaeraceae bacterium]
MTVSKTQPSCNIKALQIKYQGALEQTNALIRAQIVSKAPQTVTLDETLNASRGKQLRPLFTYAIFTAWKNDLQKAIPLASVFESIHVASLLHDDVIDKCHQRRNMPTMNNLYGDGVAILLGDMVFVAIYSLAASMNEIWLIEEVSKTVRILIEGELFQQEQRFNADTAESEYEAIVAGKTAALLELCCYASARIAGKDEQSALTLKFFGRQFGIMFQIVDDWADFMRSQEDDHKDRGVDIANGFVTLPWLILLNEANQQEHQQIIALIEKRQPAGMGHALINKLAYKYDLPKLMNLRIAGYKKDCEEALAKLENFDSTEMLTFLNFLYGEFLKISENA